MTISYEGVCLLEEGQSSSLDCWEDYSDDVSCLTDYSGMSMSDIEEPGSNDVICQPQGEDFRHIGNQKFQHVMKDYSYIFQKATSDEDRIEIAAKLVKIWRSLEPIGRFLIRQKDSTIKKWYDAGDEEAVTWTTHKLEESNDIHHDECRDDNTASTACSSLNHSSGQQQQHRTSFGSTKRQNEQVHGVSDCFGGFFRSAFLSLFAIEQKDGGILQQYLP